MFDASHLDALDGITFVTDLDGAIAAIGARNWDAFAIENNSAELNAQSVLGHSLFTFVSGCEVQEQLKRAMRRISHRPEYGIAMPFRCDSPGRLRNMRQSLTPIFSTGSCEGILFQSIELQSSDRPPIDIFDFQAMERRAAQDIGLPTIAMCSWCQKVRFEPIGGDKWIEAEDYYAVGGRSNVRISHGICEDCAEAVSQQYKHTG